MPTYELPFEVVERIDKLCDSFESALRNNQQPTVESYLASWQGSGKSQLLQSLVEIDLGFLLRSGVVPEKAEYLRRFPSHAGMVEAAFASVMSRASDATLNETEAYSPPQVPDTSSALDTSRAPPISRRRPASRSLSKKIGRFRIDEFLGSGGFGNVYRGYDPELDRIVAIKVPRRDRHGSWETDQFFREARAAAQIKHPNIVGIHEVSREDGTIFIVSEFVEGVDLADWLKGTRPTQRQAAELCAEVADALHHAHESGVVHRDLKPSNIMMDGNGEPHIMDFGLAKREVGEVTMTAEGKILGTPAYMSPEQAQGEAHRADRRSDVYSLGVILFELLTGERPFRGTVRMLLNQVIHDAAPSPRKFNALVPADLETICLKCLEKEKTRRFPSAAEFANELRRHVAGKPILSRPVSRRERLWRWGKRNPVVASLGTTATLLLVTVAVIASVAYFRVADAQKKTDKALTRESNALADVKREQQKVIVERDVAEEAQKQEAAERRIAERRLALNYLDRALALCQQSEFGRAMLWMVRSLETLPPDSEDLEHAIRANLAVWEAHVHTPIYPKPVTSGDELFNTFSQQSLILCAAFSDDGKQILVGYTIMRIEGKRRVRVAHRSNIQLISCDTLEPMSDALLFEGELTDVRFSPDGKRILATGFVGRSSKRAGKQIARMWDATTLDPIGPVIEQPYARGAMSFGQDGKSITLAGSKESGEAQLHILNANSGDPRFKGHSQQATTAVFSPDGKRVLTGSYDGTARLWSVESGERRAESGERRAEKNSVDSMATRQRS